MCHNQTVMLASKWLNVTVSYCLTEANGSSNMLYFMDVFSLSIFFSGQDLSSTLVYYQISAKLMTFPSVQIVFTDKNISKLTR